MSCCGGNGKRQNPAERAASQSLEKKLYEDHQLDQSVNKLLLLGAGESGKSTLFKQMKVLYGTGFGEDRSEHKLIVYSNVLSGIKDLITASEEIKTLEGCQVSAENRSLTEQIMALKDNAPIEPKVGAAIKAVWEDPGIQKCFVNRNLFQLTDSAPYFLNKISEVAAPDYVPSDDDILHTRVRTTGIVEDAYRIDGNTFKMFDVGGQRNERKKWIHCFSDVTAVLFVAALSAYDLKLYEDETTNRMKEALDLFKEISNSRWFKGTSVILMLNKMDLFKEKITKTNITVAPVFAEYKGPQEFAPAAKYIQTVFEALAPKGKQIYTHVTCATDTSNMRVVFNAVKDIVIQRSLEEGGLLDYGE